MSHRRKELLIILILVGQFIIKSNAARKLSKLYFCNVEEGKRLDRSLQINRFLLNQEFIYMILANQLITFKVPILKPKFKVSFLPLVYEINPLDELGEVFYCDLVEIAKRCADCEETVDTFELYDDADTKELESQLNNRKLNFNDLRRLGERMIKVDDYIDPTKAIEKSSNFSIAYKIRYVYMKKELHFYFNYMGETTKSITLFNGKYQRLMRDKWKLNYRVKHAAFSISNMSRRFFLDSKMSDKRRILKENSLVEVDDESNFHITMFFIQLTKDNAIELASKIGVTMKFSELFGCQTSLEEFKKVENKDKVKGIYFDLESEIFFIIMRTFHIRINDDLVLTNFDIGPDQYKITNALMFEVDDQLDLRSVDEPTKWTRTYGKLAYLSLDTHVFRLKSDIAQHLLIVQQDNEPILTLCRYQTFKLKDSCFCFNEKFYYLVEPDEDDPDEIAQTNTYKIKQIFDKSDIHFDDDEQLEFIFNYKSNSFVLMTDSNLYVIDYDSIRLDFDNKLIYNPNSAKKLTKLPNRLFNRTDGFYFYFFSLILIICLLCVVVYILMLYFAKRHKIRSVRFTSLNLSNLSNRLMSSMSSFHTFGSRIQDKFGNRYKPTPASIGSSTKTNLILSDITKQKLDDEMKLLKGKSSSKKMLVDINR